MRNKIILKLLLILLFLSSFAVVFAAEDGRITDIRFWQSPEEAQVVLDISIVPRVSPVSRLKDGTLYFDINNCMFRPGRQRYPMQNPFLEVLTVQQIGAEIVRVFFRVPTGVEAKTFVLPGNASKGNRIVIFLKEPQSQLIKRRSAELTEVNRLKAENVKIIVLDPGHGGEDPGTRTNGIIEKNYVMTMGKLLKAYFDRDPRFKAVLTRDGDYIIPLQRRREIAEQLGADAFISLHANYNSRKVIRGAEIYYESPRGAVGEAERLVAETENQVDFSGETNNNHTQDVKREIVERQAAVMNKSRQLAERVELQLGASVVELPSRGVKRAGFKVLHSMAMPSVLVEFGYTSNLLDAAVLKNYNARTRMAQGVYLGVRDFLLNPIEEGLDTSYLEYIKSDEANKKALAQKRKAAQAKKDANKKKASRYQVKAGDSLSKIASKNGVPLARLLNLNNITSKHIIKVGDTLLIPAK
ncbi:MAG: N-acetylmuramoyl-L-alanine amidase [Candidatus Riflebacteria bacterium]|nr:N-acetylmuramoyl-L-alanine amidase [Candidatus Riflebacteria bacterium]